MKDYYAKWVHQIKTPIAGLQFLLQMERSELEEAESKDEITEELYVKQLQNLTDVEEELFVLMSIKSGITFFKHPWNIFTADTNARIPDSTH